MWLTASQAFWNPFLSIASARYTPWWVNNYVNLEKCQFWCVWLIFMAVCKKMTFNSYSLLWGKCSLSCTFKGNWFCAFCLFGLGLPKWWLTAGPHEKKKTLTIGHTGMVTVVLSNVSMSNMCVTHNLTMPEYLHIPCTPLSVRKQDAQNYVSLPNLLCGKCTCGYVQRKMCTRLTCAALAAWSLVAFANSQCWLTGPGKRTPFLKLISCTRVGGAHLLLHKFNEPMR